MFFVLSKLFWIAFAPSRLICWCFLLALVLRRWRPAASKTLAALSALLLFALGICPSYLLVLRPLEDRFPRPAWPKAVAGIVVLSDGLESDVLARRGAPAEDEGVMRLVSAFEVARRYPQARVIYSGGSGALGGSKLSEAWAGAYIFRQMGLASGRLLLEDKSRNTHENLIFSKSLAAPKPGETWMLATSAWHMPRAMLEARGAGWPMMAWVADYRTAPTGWGGFFNIPRNLMLFDLAAHEWLGLLTYHLRGDPAS